MELVGTSRCGRTGGSETGRTEGLVGLERWWERSHWWEGRDGRVGMVDGC